MQQDTVRRYVQLQLSQTKGPKERSVASDGASVPESADRRRFYWAFPPSLVLLSELESIDICGSVGV